MKLSFIALQRVKRASRNFLFLLIALVACTPEPVDRNDSVDRLAREILSLESGIDPLEARRAAQLSHSYAGVLSLEYEITDPPLVHNTKVNMGLKPRGLCWHWAEDMERRLIAEKFATLDIHRAISRKPFRIDHSTAVISAKGQSLESGIVLDPWRTGGELFWIATTEDDRYDWRQRSVVLAEKYGPGD